MAFFSFSLLNLLLITTVTKNSLSQPEGTHQVLIKRLFDLTSQMQSKIYHPFVPLKHWEQHKGVYKSSVKLNFHGPFFLAEARRLMDVYDNNMFATAWVTSSLLESFRYDPRVRPNDEQLELALEVIDKHRDKNSATNTSIFNFWRQKYNETTLFWESAPANLLSGFKLLDDLPLPLIETILKDLGFKSIASIIQSIKSGEQELLQAFHIPPDFDDTFVNLGLGALLSDLRHEFPPIWDTWQKGNPNIHSVLKNLKKYAYRPLSSDPSVNTIDPRSYYYMRDFLEKSVSNGEEIALVTTWVQNIEDLREQYKKGVAMPFQVNNIDITVAANTIYGMTSAVLAGLFPPNIFNDKEISEIYLSTSSLIAFMLKNNMTGRPDLALTYYPSEMEFNWFVSRTLSEMESYRQEKPLPHPVLKKSFNILNEALTGKMTHRILSKAKTDDKGDTFFDDFLGNDDLTPDNKTLNRAEDRIFTTSMAANALMYTWSIYNKKSKNCVWKSDTPKSVKNTIKTSIGWLSKNTLDGNYEPWNTFFSGSVKSEMTLPFWYPANLYEHLNGTKVKDWTRFPEGADVLGMSGYVTKTEYDKMIGQKHFKENTPINFHGFNGGSKEGWFPFWSSEAFTYATTMVALARYDCIHQY